LSFLDDVRFGEFLPLTEHIAACIRKACEIEDIHPSNYVAAILAVVLQMDRGASPLDGPANSDIHSHLLYVSQHPPSPSLASPFCARQMTHKAFRRDNRQHSESQLAFIGTPYEVTHNTHVEFDSSTGQFLGLPETWRERLADEQLVPSEQVSPDIVVTSEASGLCCKFK
jgi:hypothetical protein